MKFRNKYSKKRDNLIFLKIISQCKIDFIVKINLISAFVSNELKLAEVILALSNYVGCC